VESWFDMAVIEDDRQTALDVAAIQRDFPILEKVRPHGKRLAYLDNAATSQTPQQVIDAIVRYYTEENANIHRGVHHLSQLATQLYDEARKKVKTFLGAPVGCQVIFTRGTTEALNLVAQTYGRANIHAEDEILITAMEHHSNIVPWQMLAEEKGAILKVAPIHDDGSLDMEAFTALLTERTKIVACPHVSNALGTVNPIKTIAKLTHDAGAILVVDGAQSVPHMPVNVAELGCDFYAISGHKMYGPTGIGVLYGRGDLLEKMPPWQGGGDMILSVTFEKTVFNHTPYKFEAGTPHIEGVLALGAAVDYLQRIDMAKVAAYEAQLLAYGTEALQSVDGINFIGTAPERAGVLSFTMDHAHPHDIGQICDMEGVAIRAGHHCAQPVMQRFGIPATARASLGIYNTREDIDQLVAALHKVNEIFG